MRQSPSKLCRSSKPVQRRENLDSKRGAPMRGTIGARGYPWGTKEPSGRSLRGRSAQAQVQVRGYKEEKLELAARTLCFICPSFASCALVRCLFTQCSLSLSLSSTRENRVSSNCPWLEPGILVCIRSSSLDPLPAQLDQVGVTFLYIKVPFLFFSFSFRFGLCRTTFVVLLAWWWGICISRDSYQ